MDLGINGFDFNPFIICVCSFVYLTRRPDMFLMTWYVHASKEFRIISQH